jgi:hypothetical protein
MALRGFNDQTPLAGCGQQDRWPDSYIDEPFQQLQILAGKYLGKEQGRIPLPLTAQQLWSQHKYSVLARDVGLYQKLGPEVAAIAPKESFAALANLLSSQLRRRPTTGGLKNALQHMWGYVADGPTRQKGAVETWTLEDLLSEIQHRSLTVDQPYLLASTALSELKAWLPEP